ncbi:MAG: ferrochelatase [Marinicellaceae bacterium]
MKFINHKNYEHGSKNATGILITNLGTPDAPTKKALKKYLKQFLSDPRLVESTFPRWVWLFILNAIILNIRPAKSAKAYEQVWGHYGEGSPLLDIAKQQKSGIQELLNKEFDGPVEVALGMRYGNPSIPDALNELKDKGVRRLLVLPLYPQYSATTTGSTFDEVTQALQKWRWIPEMRFVNHYFKNEGYITALANSIKNHWQKHGQPQKLVISFHGIPKRYLMNGDPYFCECQGTARRVAQKLNLTEDQYLVTFQSIFGREEWLKPYTDATLKSLPDQGIKDIQIICPGFSADCLETIEEIEDENKGYFIEAGGEKFSYIPALNADPEHLEALNEVILQHTQGWYERDGFDSGKDSKEREIIKQQYELLKY